MDPIRRLVIAAVVGIAIFAAGAGLFLATGDLFYTAAGYRGGIVSAIAFAFFPAIKRLATE